MKISQHSNNYCERKEIKTEIISHESMNYENENHEQYNIALADIRKFNRNINNLIVFFNQWQNQIALKVYHFTWVRGGGGKVRMPPPSSSLWIILTAAASHHVHACRGNPLSTSNCGKRGEIKYDPKLVSELGQPTHGHTPQRIMTW